jgi:hypothetical protein
MFRSSLAFLLFFLISFPAFSGWTNWATLGGQITSDPAACSAGGFTFVFAKGTDDQIWYRIRYLSTGVWGAWKKTPLLSQTQNISVTGSPAALCFHSTSSDTFLLSVIGSDKRLWSVSGKVISTNAVFGKWNSVGGFTAALYTGPALAGWPNYRTFYFVRGADNFIYVRTVLNSPTPNPPPFQVLIAEPIYNDPAAVMTSSDRVDFFYRDQFGKLWWKLMLGTTWFPPTVIPGVTYSGPEVVGLNTRTLDLFAKGFNNTLIHNRAIDGSFGNWDNMGGYLVGGPGATTYANSTRMMVFARWTDGRLWYRAWAP